MASNTGRVAVRIPVEAEISNVSKTIEELKRALENVKPETKGYKQIEQLLEGAEKKVLQIQKATASGLIDKASLRTLEKNFEDVFSSVEVAAKRLGNVNYENLKIPDSVVQSIKDLEQQMDAAKKAYTKLEGTKLAEVAASSKELGESLNAIGVNFDTDNIDASLDKTEKKITAVREKIDELNESAQRNQLVAQNNRNKSAELQKIKDIFKEGNQGKKARAARTEFFDKNGNFKAGGKDAIEAYLRNFQLDENFIEQVKKLSGSRLSELEEVANNIINKKQKSVDSRATKAQNEADLSGQMAAIQTADLQKLQALRTTLADLKVDPEVQSSFEAMTQELESLRSEVERLKGSAVKASGVGKAAGEAVEGVGNAASSVQDKLAGASSELERMTNIGNTVSNMKNAIAQWMGFYQVVNLVKSAVRNIISDIRELDKVMTEIAIVTNMTQKDLWAQMNTYQSIAREYGVSTKGVYEVSQLFYQQGLDSVSVMKLTTETLKMAKIAGLDYSTATDYMTVAIRGFHLEMDQAQNVVDVYSNIASKSASSTTELAEAMSKTASSAAAVGSSFENTTAMIAMMVETTRESASNIGSAMKSIISRYGEMKASPAKLVDSEGEELDFNKVDTALKSVGISMHTAAGQFRNFDDVILELSKKWQTLDINTQRYIATVMAGNRQQSRFLALVSDYDRLSELVEEAANSQDAGTLQTLKTMDSLETKIQNVKTAWQGFYANLGLEDIFKGVLDNITNLLNRLNSMPKIFGKVPVLAIALVAKLISVVKSLGTMIITQMAKTWQEVSKIIEDQMANGGKRGAERIKEAVKNNASPEEIAKLQAQHKDATKKRKWSAFGQGLNVAGTALSTYALTLDDSEARKRGGIEIGGGVLSAIGSGISTGIQSGNVFLGILSGIASGAASVIAGINDLQHAEYLELEAAKKRVEKAKEASLVAKSEATSLESAIKKLKELEEAKYDSNEAYQEWLDYKTQIVETYPELLQAYSLEGEAILDLSKGYILLAQKREAATRAALEEKQAALLVAEKESKQVNEILGVYENFDISSDFGDKAGSGLSNVKSSRQILRDGETWSEFYTKSDGSLFITQDQFDLIFSGRGFRGSVNPDNPRGSAIYTPQYSYGNVKIDQNTINSVISSGSTELKQIYAAILYQIFNDNDLLNAGGIVEQITSYNKAEIEEATKKFNPEETANFLLENVFLPFISKGEEYTAVHQQVEKVGKQLALLANSFSSIITNMVETLNPGDQERLNELAGKASTNKILAQLMMPDKGDSGFDTLEDWQASGDEHFTESAEAAIKKLLEFYNSIGDEQYDSIISFISHPEKFTKKENYKSELQNILNKFNVDDQLVDVFLKLADASWQDISESAQQNFQDMMAGNIRNTKTLGIKAIATNFANLGDDIAPELLSKLISQWGEMVNQAGTTAEAKGNAKFLYTTYNNVVELADTVGEEASQVVQGILANATLSTREGLQAAITALENYQKSSGKDLGPVIRELEKQRDSLIINLNTELQSYAATLNTATKGIAAVYKNQGSGFDDFEEMQKELARINASRNLDEQLNFSDVYVLDESLNKMIYTSRGLAAALATYQTGINEGAEEFSKAQTKKIEALDNASSDIQQLLRQDDSGDRAISVLQQLSEKYAGKEEGVAVEGILKYVQQGYEIITAIRLYQEEIENYGQQAEQLQNYAEQLTNEAQQIANLNAIDFASVIKGDKSAKITSAIKTWYNSLLTTDEGLAIIEKFAGTKPGNIENMTEEQIAQAYNEFEKGFYSKLTGDVSTGLSTLKDLLDAGFDYDTAVSWYNAKIKTSYDLLASAFDKAPQEIIQLTEEQARFLENESIAISNNEGIKTVTVQTLIDSADRLWGTIEAAFQAGIISLDSYINAYKNNHTSLGLKNTRSIISNLNSYSIGTNITDLEIGEKLKTLGYNLKEVRDAADNLIGYYIIDIPNNLREAYNQLYEDIVANGGTQSEQNDAWAKMMTANSASNTLDLISSAQKLTYEKFAEAANNAGKDAAELYQRYLNEGVIRIVNGQIQVVKINEFLEGMNIDPASAEYKQAVDEFNQAMASNYATLIKTNNRAAINAINAIGKTSLTIDDFAQLFGSEEEMAKVFNKQGDIINRRWQKVIKRVGPDTYDVVDFDGYIELVNKGLQQAGQAIIQKNSQAYLNAYKNWVSGQNTKYDFSGFEIFLADFKEVTYTQLVEYAKSIGKTVEQVESASTFNASTGTYDITNVIKAEGLASMMEMPLNLVRTMIKDGDAIADSIENYVAQLSPEMAEKVSKYASEALRKLFDRASKDIQKDLEALGKGTKKFATLSELKDYNKTLKFFKLDDNDYVWDEVARNYVLTAEGLQKSIRNYSHELWLSVYAETGDIEKANAEVARQLNATVSSAAENINISQYISSDRMKSDVKTITDAYNQFVAIIKEMGEQISLTSEEFVQILNEGGESAVRVAEILAKASGKELTYKNLTDTYRAEIAALEDGIAQIEYGIGAVINERAYDILEAAGYKFEKIGNGKIAVITKIGDIEKAYNGFVTRMAEVPGATLAKLNEQTVAAIQGSNVNRIASIASNAANQSLESFGNTLAQKGIQLAEVWEDWTKRGIISYDGSNVHVLDLQAYFKELGIEITDQIMSNPAYVAGLNAYNEGLLELNRATETRIVEEVEKISQASAGDRVNLTYFNSVLNKLTDEQQEVLIQELERSGAVLQDGILYISDNADMLGISVAIGRAANQTGLLLASEIAQVGDSVNNALKTYVQILNNGIQGTLSNEDANTLRQYAKSLGIELDFTRTEEGLKLSVNSATQLVAKLREVDAYAAKTSFTVLKDSIKASNDGCQTLEETLRTIVELETQMNKNPGNDAVRERLELYRQIRDEQMDDSNSYNFMSRALPNGMQGAENYWNSWGTAFKAMNEAATTGYIGIQDFYNIVNEMNYIAGESGQTIDFMGYSLNGELTNMASLIQEGMNAIKNVDGEGAKIDLSGFSTSLLAGAEGMENGVEAGIKAFARAQIKMLDAAIQMLEGIVALQELGEIDTDKSGIIDFGELFTGTEDDVTGFQELAINKANEVKAAADANEQLRQVLEQFRIGELNLYQIMGYIANNDYAALDEAGLNSTTLLSFLNAIKNINFSDSDLSTISETLSTALTNAFQGAEVTLGEDGSITVVIGAKDIQTEVTEGAQAAVAEEAQAAVAGKVNFKGLFGNASKSTFTPQINDPKSDLTGKEDKVNEFGVQVDGVTLEPSEGFTIDADAILRILEEFVRKALVPTDEQGNKEGGWTLLGVISDFLFEIINGLQERIQGNIDKKARPVVDEAVQEENKNLNVDLKGKVSNLELDGPGSTTKSKDFDTKKQTQLELFKTQYLSNIPLNGSGDVSIDCVYHLNDTGDGVIITDASGNEIGQIPVSILNDFVGLGELSAGNCKVEYDSETGNLTLIIGNGKDSSISIPLNDYVTFNGTGNLLQGDISVKYTGSKDLKGLELKNAPTSVGANLPSETSVTAEGDASTVDIGLAKGYTAGLTAATVPLTTTITTASGDTYTLTINPLSSKLNKDNVDVGNVETVTGSTDTATITTDTNADITLKKPNGEEQKAVVKGSALIQSLADGSILQEDAQNPGTYSLPDFTVYGEVEITPESIAKAQAQLRLIELQQDLIEAREWQQHYYGVKQGARNNNTIDQNAEEEYNYWNETVNSLQEEIEQVGQVANSAYISSRTQGSIAPHTFSDTYSSDNNDNNNNDNNTPTSADINTPETTLSTNSLAVKVNEGGSTSVDTSEEPLSVTAGRVIFDLANALSNSSSIAESGSAVASAAKNLLGLYFSKDENKIDAIVGVGKIVVSMAGGSPETVTKVGNLARGAASLATEASKGYAAAYESAAAGATIKVAPTLGKLVAGVLGNLAPYLIGAAAVAAVTVGVIKFVEAKNRQLNFEFEPGAVFDENGDIHVEGKKLIYSLTGIDFEGRDKTEKSVAQQILDILNTAGQGKTSILDLPPEIQEYVNNKKNNPNYEVNEEFEHEIAYYDNLRQSLEDGVVTLTDLENVMMLFFKRRSDLSQYWENRVGKQLGSTAIGGTVWNFFPNLFGTLTGGENSFGNLSNFETWQYLYARMQRSKNDVDENNPFDVLLSGLSDTWDQLYTDIADQLEQYISQDAKSFDFTNFLMKTGITPETLANMIEYRNLRTGSVEGSTITKYKGMADDTSEMQGYVLLYLNIIKRILADAGELDYDVNVSQNVEAAREQATKAIAAMKGAVETAEQAAEQTENSKQETEENTEWTQEDVTRLETAVQLAQTVLNNLTSKTDEATAAQTNLQNIVTEAQTAIDRYEALGEGSDFASKMEQVTTAIAEATGEKELTVTGDINALKTLIEDYLADPKTTNVNLNPITASIENYLNNTPHQTKVTLIASQLVGLREVINNALAGIGNVTVGVSGETEGEATGNVALAGGRGTLMGELGPELYVTNGHYYVAGQNGAEFVNLPDDAIVFNHLQTQRLLENGHAGRGRVVTNERKATSLATGNMSGPAMASAAAVLAQLKQIRAMWDAMLKAPLSDFGSKAGTGKKGGGGGGSKNKDKTDNNSANLDSGYIKDLERWYNLLRKIEKLEQDISYEEKLRSKLQADSVSNGKLIYESYRRSYEALQKEVDNRVKLAELKKGYYEQQMEELKNSKWADFFYFDDEGTIQRKTSGSEFLANLYATNANGGAIHSAREQYQMLLNAGYGSLMEYKEDGSKIEWTDSSGKAREDAYAEAVKAFSSKIDSQTEAYESLREDYMNEMESILDAQIKQNEILTAIRENTVAVEQEVLDAILSAREREIKELQNQRDALQDSSDKFINGLTDELNKERDMYNQQQEDKELAQLYRQLGILQRSGASASQIRSIQDQISQKEQDAYFEGQQKQIDAIKEASDLQLERLDAQISLMSETLEYQKAHGLLWDQVYQIMQLSESEIADFITTQNPDWWSKSMTQRSLDMVELGNKIQQWTAYRDDISDTKNAITNAINNGIAAITNVVARVSTPNVYTATGDGGYIPSTGTSSDGTTGGSGGGTGSTSGKTGGNGGKKLVGTTSSSHGYSFVFQGKTYANSGYASADQAANAMQARINDISTQARVSRKEMQSKLKNVKVYANGGLIDFTGPAWVDGTKKKPEGILNAEQLDMLRNSVLTRKNPVAALLADYQGIVSDTAGSNAYNSINQNNGVNVERIELNMNVSKMSNDYDARRAADTMMDEVIRIARKSGATSVSRR